MSLSSVGRALNSCSEAPGSNPGEANYRLPREDAAKSQTHVQKNVLASKNMYFLHQVLKDQYSGHRSVCWLTCHLAQWIVRWNTNPVEPGSNPGDTSVHGG
jgi:hypothetical protein